MSGIYGVEALDGNIYQVKYSNDSNSVTGDSFDTVFNEINAPVDLESIFSEAASKYGVNENLLKAVAYAESGFDTNATSSAGAQGIMQLMPYVAEDLGVTDPYNARQNINAGASLLSSLLSKYNGNVTLSLAAYNAGSGNVSKYNGVPPFKETQNYIAKINDLLGGALSGDSTTLDGTSPATVIEESLVDIPSTKIYSNSNSQTNEESTQLNTNANAISNSAYLTVANNEKLLELLKALANSGSNSSTYKDSVMLDLVSLITGNYDSDEDSNDYISSLYTNSATSTVSDSDESLLSSYLSSLSTDELDALSKNSQLQEDFGLSSEALALTSKLNNQANNILETDLYSLYEAQSSVMSPVLAKLLNL